MDCHVKIIDDSREIGVRTCVSDTGHAVNGAGDGLGLIFHFPVYCGPRRTPSLLPTGPWPQHQALLMGGAIPKVPQALAFTLTTI